MTTLEITAHELEANCGSYLDQVLSGVTLIVVVDGQRTLKISTTHPGGPTYSLSPTDFACDLSDYALLVALHGRTYRLFFVTGNVFVTRAPGYYSEFLDRWERSWTPSVTML